jgi:hypothetical protein
MAPGTFFRTDKTASISTHLFKDRFSIPKERPEPCQGGFDKLSAKLKGQYLS